MVNLQAMAEEFELMKILEISGYSRPLDYYTIRPVDREERQEKSYANYYGIEFDPKREEFNKATRTKKEV